MTIDITKLNRLIDKAKIDIEKNITTQITKLALAVDQTVVLATPVDEGRARANWLPSINTKIESPKDRTDKNGSVSIEEMQATVSDFKLGDTIFISNNLPYIGALNDGHSKQAPVGYIEKAVQTAKAALENG